MLREFDEGLAWLKSQGTPSPSEGRFTFYRSVLDDLANSYKTASKEDVEAKFSTYADVLFEANDFILTYRGLSHGKHPGLKKRLERLIGGPQRRDMERSEDGSSVRARNTGFELAVAARLADAGFPPDFQGPADTNIAIENRKVFIECKRVRSDKKIISNANEAIRQCNTRISNSSSKLASGIIVLDFSVTANPDAKTAAFESRERAQAVFKALIESFVAEHCPRIPLGENKKILALMLRYCGLVVTEGRLLNHAQEWAYVTSPFCEGHRPADVQTIGQALGRDFGVDTESIQWPGAAEGA
ncbi:MAG: hypothetical protein OSA97_05735 [Nevskia sp.]|nr:hypothetical protein [Nevskia sp.]